MKVPHEINKKPCKPLHLKKMKSKDYKEILIGKEKTDISIGFIEFHF